MSTERLPQLDAIITLAARRPTRVYLDDSFPLHLRGISDWSPIGRHYNVVLNPALTTWLADEFEPTAYHEAIHIREGHVSTALSVAQRSTAYHKVISFTPRSYDESYPTIGSQLKEHFVEVEVARLRNQWPFAAYKLMDLLRGRETYP